MDIESCSDDLIFSVEQHGGEAAARLWTLDLSLLSEHLNVCADGSMMLQGYRKSPVNKQPGLKQRRGRKKLE
ncbi:hypothetical protein INR49_027214, partial [Caranx melampygus]